MTTSATPKGRPRPHVDDRINALYELGVTTGQNDMVGEKGVFNPNGLMTRAQMASAIMRTMGHTNLRPAGAHRPEH